MQLIALSFYMAGSVQLIAIVRMGALLNRLALPSNSNDVPFFRK